MMKEPPERCPHCDAKMVEYKHGMSKGLARALRKISEYVTPYGEYHIAKCGLSYSERENSRKLKYWGIIKKLGDPDSKGGNWKLTVHGLAFISGDVSVPKSVHSYRGEQTRYSGKQVMITDLGDGWKYRPVYAREAKPHDPNDTQQGLF